MKRHKKLIPYSRFHRKILFLALIVKENAPEVKGYPTETQAKINYALSFYKEELTAHFKLEQINLFDFYLNKDKEVDVIIKELIAERTEINNLFQSLSVNKKEATLHQLGELLEKHVRKEERIFFQLLQQKFLDL